MLSDPTSVSMNRYVIHVFFLSNTPTQKGLERSRTYKRGLSVTRTVSRTTRLFTGVSPLNPHLWSHRPSVSSLHSGPVGPRDDSLSFISR